MRHLLFLLILVITTATLCFPVFASSEEDTTQSIKNIDTLAVKMNVPGDEFNPNILAFMDSLVALNFYTNLTFTDDTNQLNTFLFAKDSIPVYPDSVIIKQLEDLNRETIMELSFNKYVKNYIVAYSQKRREVASRVLGLSEVYFPLFEEYLDKYNMPLELKYLAVVESALNPTANSRAGAKGLWQFMYSTGKLYGLKVNSLVDDRFDPIKSTDAACRHLQDLYNIYGNWALALAAYNSGPGNVNKAIRRAGGTKSYWAVWPYLPRETRGYVPAFIAVAYIMNHAADYNLYPIHPGIFHQEIDTVMINDVLSFDQISELMGISMDELKFLNPAYKTGIIPAKKDQAYVLRLPYPYIGPFVEKEKELYAYKTKKGIEKEKLLAEIKKATERNIHIVRSGENLGLIAQKNRCSVSNIKSWNNLRSNTIYPGQKLVIYAPGYTGPKTTSTTSTATDVSDRDKNTHTVKNGENLGLIANKYKCSVSDLKAWNNLKGNTIQPKQKLIVYEPKVTPMETTKKPETSEEGGFVYHTVRSGDTLWDIAKLYDGVSVEQIKELNNIRNSKRLKPGQKLKVKKA
ncbi:MAG: LysM peptidoglycan-binding domain-containing protein [Bacteroidales bacterium]|nr:LysM peptidoglycan-binding domain-containing protein [Bacteroidales bacterium]MCF8403528.1 LysM peptidoglycan-binding domain-containing protein [Bacteroidales bacterium]